MDAIQVLGWLQHVHGTVQAGCLRQRQVLWDYFD
jgi:hypothetical protein